MVGTRFSLICQILFDERMVQTTLKRWELPYVQEISYNFIGQKTSNQYRIFHQVHANCRLRRIYFADRLYSEEEVPHEFKLYVPIRRPAEADNQGPPGQPPQTAPLAQQGPSWTMTLDVLKIWFCACIYWPIGVARSAKSAQKVFCSYENIICLETCDKQWRTLWSQIFGMKGWNEEVYTFVTLS